MTSSENTTAHAECTSSQLNYQRSAQVTQTDYSPFVSTALKREKPRVNDGRPLDQEIAHKGNFMVLQWVKKVFERVACSF